MPATLTALFEQRVRSLWSTMTMPAELVGLADMEGHDVEAWLRNRTYMEAAEDEQRLESQMPLLFLQESACPYYLGAYLLRFSRALDQKNTTELVASFAVTHFLYFISSERGVRICQYALNHDQRTLVGELADELICSVTMALPFEDWKGLIAAIQTIKNSHPSAGD